MLMEKMGLVDWYTERFPDDEMGYWITPGVTFQDLFDCLDHYRDVYKLIGVGDSVVRERLFSKLAELIGTSYDYVYEQWMRGCIA